MRSTTITLAPIQLPTRTSSTARRRVSRVATLAVVFAAALAAGRTAMAAGVIDKVPDDAMVVIKVSDLGATSGKLAKLVQDLGLDMLEPKLADPLGALKQEMHIDKGLNEHGEVAIVMLDPSKHGNAGPDQAVLVLIPTSDFAGLTAGLDGAKVDGDVTSFRGAGGQPMFIADWGDGFAAQSPSRDLIATKPTAFIKPSDRAARELKTNDITMFANLPLIRGPVTEQMHAQHDQAKASFLETFRRGQAMNARRAAGANGAPPPAGANGNPDQDTAVAGAAFDQMFNAAEAFLRDADAATVGFTLTDTGVRENLVADFRPDTYLGGLAAQLKPGDDPLVTGLPAAQYLVYGGVTNTPAVTTKIIDDLFGPIVQAVPASKSVGADATAAGGAIDAATVKAYLEGVKTLAGHIDRWSFGAVTPQGQIGQSPLFQVLGSMHGEADAMIKSAHDLNDRGTAITNGIVGMQGVQIEQKWDEGTRKVGDVTFDTVTTSVLGDTPAANQMRQQFQLMYGKPSAEAMIGKVGDHDVLSFMGVGDDLVTQAIAATRENQAPLAALDQVKSVTGQLPGKHVAELYVALDQIFATGVRAGNQMGFLQGTVQLPPDLPPVGLALSNEGPAIEGAVFLPSDLLQALVSAGIQLSQRRGGGGRPGGGGL